MDIYTYAVNKEEMFYDIEDPYIHKPICFRK